MTAPVRVLAASDVRALLTWPALVAATRDALIALADPASAPTGSSTQVAVPGAALHLKAGALLAPPVLSVKANLRPDSGSSSGALLVFDHRQQRLEAVVAGADLTAMRTGAIAAVAAEALLQTRRPQVALVGAGPVARQVWAALLSVLQPAGLRVWSRSAEHAQALAGLHPLGRGCTSIAEAVAGADLVVTCTPSRQPLLLVDDVGDDALVLAMGADTPGKRELGPGLVDGAQVYADVVADALLVGECAYRTGDRPVLPLGAVLTGTARRRPGLCVVDSVGSAAVDAAAAALVVRGAAERGLGTVLDLAR